MKWYERWKQVGLDLLMALVLFLLSPPLGGQFLQERRQEWRELPEAFTYTFKGR